MACRKKRSEGKGGDRLKPECRWGSSCYRRNQDHLLEFSHPSRVTGTDASRTSEPTYLRRQSPSKTLFLKEKTEISPSSTHKAALLQSCYGMSFPEDLFDLWRFCEDMSPGNPREALVSLLGIRLTGPYDVLALHDQIDTSDRRIFNLHARFFYDPPEFQTVMIDLMNNSHYGLFRDDPSELPVFVALSQADRKDAQPWKLVIAGSNLMQVIYTLLRKRSRDADDSRLAGVYKDALGVVAKVTHNKHFVSYKSKRKSRAIGKVIHHVGFVVPYDEKTRVGYRPLPIGNVELRQLMLNVAMAEQKDLESALKPLQELVTLTNFANDECDYGMGLELGLDCFLYGSEKLHSLALFLLENAYNLLKRPKFFEIVRDHIGSRNAMSSDCYKLPLVGSRDA